MMPFDDVLEALVHYLAAMIARFHCLLYSCSKYLWLESAAVVLLVLETMYLFVLIDESLTRKLFELFDTEAYLLIFSKLF